MARIRTVKPDLLKHSDLYEVEADTGLPVRIAFVGLLTAADREGRFKWKPRQLKLDCLPYDGVDFELVLNAMESAGFVRSYWHQGKRYGLIPSFTTHQVINKREAQSAIPAFEDADNVQPSSASSPVTSQQPTITAPDQHENINAEQCDTTNADERTCTHMQSTVHARGERKGKEGKGRERKGSKHLSNPSDSTALTKSDLFSDQADELFEYWKVRMQRTDGSKFIGKRRNCVIARLREGYSPEQIRAAIDGCARSPHHMGQNDTGTVYDDLELICRNGSKIEQFGRNIGKVVPFNKNQPQTSEDFIESARAQAERIMNSPAFQSKFGGQS